MAYFDCIVGGASGDGVALIVQCDANFAGSTITADNGEDVFTETCPSVSPYTVRFEGIPTGTYTISGVSQGQTFTTQFTVLDYETTLNAIPEGATVLPINDIQIWLNCANIWDKNYSTISQVLADTATLLALVSSNNAADYMARSTNWASSVCANQTAMGYIGNNDYCANKLLSNSTWLNSICNSTYFESVLKVKVPTMTSPTTPSGEVYVSGYFNVSWSYGYKVFTDDSNGWLPSANATSQYLYYKFTQAVKVSKIRVRFNIVTSGTPKFVIEGSNNGSSWSSVLGEQTIANLTEHDYSTPNTTKYLYYRIKQTNSWVDDGANWYTPLMYLQFYGRA